MNALSILFRMLIRQGRKPGASMDEILHSLGFSGREMELGRQLVYRYMNVLQKDILSLIGLKIKYIPMQKTFTITFKEPLGEEYLADLSREAFETLKLIIRLFQELRDRIEVNDLVRYRNVSLSTVRKHLRELSSKGYIIVRKDKIYMSPKLIVLLEFVEKGEE